MDPAEGNLAALDKSQLAERLKGLKYEYEQASMFQSATDEMAGYDLSDVILYALVSLLLGEQILAWSASYHPSAKLRAGQAGGGRHGGSMIRDTLPLMAQGVFPTTRSNGDASNRIPIGFCPSARAWRSCYSCDICIGATPIELPLFLGWILTALRTAAFLGLLIMFLQPHWRLEREMVRNSKAVLLVDTSLSMGLARGRTIWSRSQTAGRQARRRGAKSR